MAAAAAQVKRWDPWAGLGWAGMAGQEAPGAHSKRYDPYQFKRMYRCSFQASVHLIAGRVIKVATTVAFIIGNIVFGQFKQNKYTLQNKEKNNGAIGKKKKIRGEHIVF